MLLFDELNWKLFNKKNAILLCCSGGADSMAMTHIIAERFTSERRVSDLSIIVIDHHLEDGSELTAWKTALYFYDNFDAGMILLETISVAKSKAGYEADAREARYRVVDSYIERLNAVALLAHTEDDQAECILLALLRGSGLRALSGMSRERDKYLRPLLSIRRKETLEYCKQQNLNFVFDPANYRLSHARVSVRRLLLPIYAAIMKRDIIANLARSASLLRKARKLSETRWRERSEEIERYSIFSGERLVFSKLSLVEKSSAQLQSDYIRQIIELYYSNNSLPMANLGYRHIERIKKRLFFGGIYRRCSLPSNVVLCRTKHLLVLYRKAP